MAEGFLIVPPHIEIEGVSVATIPRFLDDLAPSLSAAMHMAQKGPDAEDLHRGQDGQKGNATLLEDET